MARRTPADTIVTIGGDRCRCPLAQRDLPATSYAAFNPDAETRDRILRQQIELARQALGR